MADNPQPEVILNQSQNKIPTILRNFLTKRKALLIVLLAISPLFIIIYVLISTSLLPKPTPKQLPTPTPLKPKIQLPCPSLTVFCSQAKPVIRNNAFSGFGANLEENTPIYAVFDGGVVFRTRSVAAKPNNETFLQIELISKDKNLKAFYFIKGSPAIKYQYKQGEEITKVTKNQIKSYGSNNLIFLLTDQKGNPVSAGDILFINQVQ